MSVPRYYPPDDHEIEVCANCHRARDNPTNLVSPRCCKAPVLYRYRIVEGQVGTHYPLAKRSAEPEQSTLHWWAEDEDGGDKPGGSL